MKDLKLNITYIKVLDTINELNEHDCYPLNAGIYKILSGQKDEESLSYSYIKTYGTLVSTSSKKICNLTLMLFRHGYIEKFFHRPTNELYFKLTEKGKVAIIDFHKNSKSKYSKIEKNSKPTILKLS